MFNTPILYIVFNRLDTVENTFPKIRDIQPRKLYIAADGPRANREGEAEKCAEVRQWILSRIDWDCEVHTLFREENLGCGSNVSKAIAWFFENVEKGIVLEDDCLPDMSFFQFCEELLEKYKDNPKVMHISGSNPLKKCRCRNKESYYFAKMMHCWGWASWARSWKDYSFDIDDDFETVLNTNNFFRIKAVKKNWTEILNKMRNHEIDTWDYQWSYKILKMDGLCINPRVNLIQNIGMNSGVHFKGSVFAKEIRSYTMNFPLKHPEAIGFDYRLVRKLIRKEYLKRFIKVSIINILRSLHILHFVERLFRKS